MAERPNNVLVIFDLVSTLTDAGPRYVLAFQQVCAENGVTPPAEEEILTLLGNKNLSEITDLFAGKLEQDKKASFMNSCNNTCDALLNRPDWHETLYPHVREAVTLLHSHGVTLGIFTGTREDAMENQLHYHGIADLFDARYRRGKDNARDAGKTSDALKTEQISAIVAQFRKDKGANEVTVVIVGDSSADARAAANLGFSFIGFAENSKKREQLKKAGVTNIISDFSILDKVIDSFHYPNTPDNRPRPQPPHRPHS
jgi:phosphoglycolate phosphatase-like HAD superfamily hydrolase